jgi:7,8-dihydro-6-hydroxymethylpterin-pyrophosphokinase
MVDQDDFINAVVELNTSLSAHRVLEMCQAIEQRVRSTKAIRFGPRILDVDLYYTDNK